MAAFVQIGLKLEQVEKCLRPTGEPSPQHAVCSSAGAGGLMRHKNGQQRRGRHSKLPDQAKTHTYTQSNVGGCHLAQSAETNTDASR